MSPERSAGEVVLRSLTFDCLMSAMGGKLPKANDARHRNQVRLEAVSPPMRHFMLAFALSACAPTTAHELRSVESGPADYIENLPPTFNAQQVKADLEGAILERFGAAAIKRAQSAEAYVLSRHYQGLPQPMPPDGAPPPRIAALLILERNVWYRAETGGAFRPLEKAQQRQWVEELADTGPWAEPTYANPTCTDAGATYLMVSLPNRPFLLRAANCATPKSERLGLAAINL